MVENAETARERAIARANAQAVTSNPVPTGNNYGAFSESPFVQSSSVVPSGPTTNVVPAGGSTNPTNPTQPPKSAFALALDLLNQYGISSLAPGVKDLLQENVGLNEFSVRLKDTEPYKKRFAANAARTAKGLRALSESEYIRLEDSYQKILRNYGLPESYYKKGTDGVSQGFESLISGDVDSTELENRVILAQKRVNDADPNVKKALKEFYPDIKDADILAYTLDPTKGLEDIKRKVTAAEIGGAAMGQGLKTGMARAEELARLGVTGEDARKGFAAIGGGLERGSQLASIYQQPDYTQTMAEQEVFGLTGQTDAQRRRKKITGLEQAEFGGQSGVSGGALGRDRAGSF